MIYLISVRFAPGRAAALGVFQKKFTTPRRFIARRDHQGGPCDGGLSLWDFPDNATLAAMNKCLAQSNKSRTGGQKRPRSGNRQQERVSTGLCSPRRSTARGAGFEPNILIKQSA